MPGDLLTYPGALLRLSHVAEGDTAPTITNTRAYLSNLDDGSFVVNGAAGGFANAVETGKSEYYYDWTPSATWFTDHPTSSGDFVYRLGRLIGTQWHYESGGILLWPFFSKFDRYLEQVKSLVAEAPEGEALQQLSTRAYRDALLLAARVFAFDNPQDLFQEVTLTAGQWEYNLSALTGFDLYWSEFAEVEYPRDSTAIARPYLTPADWRLEPDRGKWSLLTTPSAGQKAGIRYTGLWTLNHTTDELPASAFQPLCLFAAGVAMGGPTANLFTRTNERGIEAQVVSYKTKSDEAAAQGKRLMDQARALWGVKKPRRRPEAFSVPGFFGVACGRRGR